MKFFYLLLLAFSFFWSIPLFSQSEISSNLIDISNVAFNKNPSIKQSVNTIRDAEANLQIQTSVFDYILLSELSYQRSFNNLLDPDPRNQFIDKYFKTNTFDFNSGLQKKFRGGQRAELGANYNFNSNNFPFDNFNQSVNPYFGNHSGTLSLSITQPLLKGRGRLVTTIPEKISELYIETAKNNFEFSNSYEILQISLAYWNYYTAFKSLEIYRQNENRARSVLEMTKELVKADKKPAGELVQISADLANQERLTVLAEQDFYNTKLNLGRTIGLSQKESENLDDPTNEFPAVSSSGYSELLNEDSLLEIAIDNRGDVKGNSNVYTALEKQLILSGDNLKPQLDLTGFIFNGSSDQGNGFSKPFSSFFNNNGQNIGVGARLTFSFPLNNNLAKGNLAKSEIALDNQQIANDNLIRNIKINISIAIGNFQNSVLVLEKAKTSLENYRQAFENEQIRFQTGLTTLLNVILFQERLTNAELQYLQASQQFANSIVILRHETGTLIAQENQGFTINKDRFYTIPNAK